MNHLLSIFMPRAAMWLLKRYHRVALDRLQIEAAVWYVHGVGAARQLFIGGLALSFVVALAGAGFVLLHLGLYTLLPAPANAITLLALGAFYLMIAILVVRWACAEKTWMKYSKAAHYVERAVGTIPPAKS